MLLRPGRTITPLARAINGVLVRLQLRLILESNVTLDSLFGETNLKELAGADGDFGFLRLVPILGLCCAILCTVRSQAPDRREVALCDGVVVKVPQTLEAEDMPTVEHFVTL